MSKLPTWIRLALYQAIFIGLFAFTHGLLGTELTRASIWAAFQTLLLVIVWEHDA